MLTDVCKSRLRAVSEKILENPLRVEMTDWFLNAGEASAKGLQVPECGTVACIAGWVVIMNSDEDMEDLVRRGSVDGAAIKLLGIDYHQGFRLFHPGDWPQNFRMELNRCVHQSRAYAKVVVERIEAFIETEGRV